jgi:hypothetical protein
VRRHAKASSAGSTQATGGSRGLVRRAFATRGASGNGKGSGAPSHRRLSGALAVLALSMLALALSASSALAGETHPYVSSFGSFTAPQSVAIDQATGNVYALDTGSSPKKISRFDSTGAAAPFSASASYITGNELTGTSTGVFSMAGGSDETQLAVAPAGAAGGTGGDLYVTESIGGKVAVFSSTGEFLGKLDGSGNTNPVVGGELCGVATDASGNVYLGYFSGHVDKYVPSANPPLNSDFNSSLTGFGGICNVAASSSTLYASRWSAGPLTARPLSAFPGGGTQTAAPAGTVIEAGGSAVTSTTAAIDPSNNDLYVDGANKVRQFDSAGNLIGTSGEGVLSQSTGVAINGSGGSGDGNLYASNGQTKKIDIYGPGVPVPDVTSGAITNRAAESVTFNGTVNPSGAPLTACTFEYGKTTSYGQTAPCAESTGAIGSGSSPVPVHADVAGLSLGNNYHFRLTATNANGKVTGADVEFATLGAQILGEALSEVTETSAVFEGIINPKGEATTYAFEYVTEAQFAQDGYASAQSVPVGGEAIGSGNANVAVVQEAAGLTPLTTYHFRLAATTLSGKTTGTDLVFTTFGAPSASLPDGRAYEQATPIDKNGNNAQGISVSVRAAAQGGGITYLAFGGVSGGEGAQDYPTYAALRNADGWTNQGLLSSAARGSRSRVLGISEDFSRSYTSTATPFIENGVLEKDTATQEVAQVYKEEGFDFENSALYTGSSADATKSVIEVPKALLPGAAEEEKYNVYLRDSTTDNLVLAGVFNNGQAPPGGAFSGPYDWYESGSLFHGGFGLYYTQAQHVISADGSEVIFTAGGTGQVYVRVNPTQPQSPLDGGGNCTVPADACTLHVSRSVRTVPDPEGTKPAQFLGAARDGSAVFFTSQSMLTNDANTGTADAGRDLYAFEPATNTLTDLTPTSAPGNPKGADVMSLVGTSEDGSYIYFGANGVLAPGASLGNCQINQGPGSGSCNLYVWHEGDIAFVSRLADDQAAKAWAQTNCTTCAEQYKHGLVSADGQTVLFGSKNNLTSYDSHGFVEFYRYRYGDSGVTCVSCRPSGEAPLGDPTLKDIAVSFIIPGYINAVYGRNLSADGNRVFFESPDKLLGADTNGVQDVYEWEAEGSGSCQSSLVNGGCLYLLSTGTSPVPSYFADASVNGDDAFVFTAQPLVGQDRDELVDIYDVRVGGGLASQNPPPPSICTGEGCRPQATPPPSTQTPGTSGFSGPSNPKPKHKKHKKKHHKKHHKKKHHKKSKGQQKQSRTLRQGDHR